MAKRKIHEKTKNQQEFYRQYRRLQAGIRAAKKLGYEDVPDIATLIGKKPKRITKQYLDRLKKISREEIRNKSKYQGEKSPMQLRREAQKARRKQLLSSESEERQRRAREEQKAKEYEEARRRQQEQEAQAWTYIHNIFDEITGYGGSQMERLTSLFIRLVSNIISQYGVIYVSICIEDLYPDIVESFRYYVEHYPSDQGVYIMADLIVRKLHQIFYKDSKLRYESEFMQFDYMQKIFESQNDAMKQEFENTHKEQQYYDDATREDEDGWVDFEENEDDFPW